MLFLHRTIIPHKKVLQKGCEQILFFALALFLRRLLPPLHQHMRLTYCSPLRSILPPAPVYNAAVDSLSAPAYKLHPTHPSALDVSMGRRTSRRYYILVKFKQPIGRNHWPSC